MPVARRAAELIGDRGPMLLAQLQDAPHRVGGLARDFDDPAQEKGEPCFPVAAFAHGLEMVVVRLPMLLEVVRQVEHGLVQHAALGQQERDQQPADAPVAVEKRVNGLELHVRERDLDQRRQAVLSVQESLQVTQHAGHHVVRRRHEGRRGERASAGADPVLARAQLAGLEPAAAYAAHQFSVDLPNQPDRHRQLRQPRQAVVHRAHVVQDFVHVARQVGREQLGFGGQHILQGTLRSLDLAGEHRLHAHIHEDEEIRKRENRAVEAPEGTVGIGEQPLQVAGQGKRRRGGQRCRDERAIARRLIDVTSCPG